MKMSDLIKFFESKKRYLQLGLGKKVQDQYEAKAVKYNPTAKIKPSIPATFIVDLQAGEGDSRFGKNAVGCR